MSSGIKRNFNFFGSGYAGLGITEDTVIFFLCDNGGVYNLPLRSGKGHYYEGGIRIPFIISWPGTLPADKIFRKPVSSLDIMATILALSGVGFPKDREMDGVNLVDFLTGKNTGDPHDVLHWACTHWKPGDVIRFAIRKGKWKLVRDASIEDKCELYDLEADIGETHNVIEWHKDIASELMQLHQTWYKSMGVPLIPPGQREEPWVRKIQKEYGDKWAEETKKTYQRWNDESLLNHD